MSKSPERLIASITKGLEIHTRREKKLDERNVLQSLKNSQKAEGPNGLLFKKENFKCFLQKKIICNSQIYTYISSICTKDKRLNGYSLAQNIIQVIEFALSVFTKGLNSLLIGGLGSDIPKKKI